MALLPASRPHFLRAPAGRGSRRPSWCGPPPARRRFDRRSVGPTGARLRARPVGARRGCDHQLVQHVTSDGPCHSRSRRCVGRRVLRARVRLLRRRPTTGPRRGRGLGAPAHPRVGSGGRVPGRRPAFPDAMAGCRDRWVCGPSCRADADRQRRRPQLSNAGDAKRSMSDLTCGFVAKAGCGALHVMWPFWATLPVSVAWVSNHRRGLGLCSPCVQRARPLRSLAAPTFRTSGLL